ncbi:MAG: family 43 glycosylhydrolase, partial [Bacteroidota bacterium]|nr:family 43 glycosylhydrolase [Bacteroidota bacterium]
MEKLNNIKYALLIVLLGGVLSCSKSKDINAPIFGGTSSSTYTNPVYKGDAPDPTVIRARDGKFYVYSTTTKILESTDMVNWTEGGNVFSGSNYPSWLPGGSVWAPDLHYIGGKYVMYYALSTWVEIHKNGVRV